MTEPKILPPSLKAWAQDHVGIVTAVRDVSHLRPASRVWELQRADGVRHFLKVSPNPTFVTRKAHAYRHPVPAVGYSRVSPQLVDSRAEDLALLLQRALPRQAGALYARLHEAGELKDAARANAEGTLEAAANGAEKHLGRAGAWA